MHQHRPIPMVLFPHGFVLNVETQGRHGRTPGATVVSLDGVVAMVQVADRLGFLSNKRI